MDGQAYQGVPERQIDDLAYKLHDRLVRLVMQPSQNCRDLCAKIVAFTHEGKDWGDDNGTLSRVIMREACELMGSQTGKRDSA